jgi:6-phosphogluconate dehydrogenase
MPVQFGMIGLGRMGTNMVRRLLRAGHQAVVFDRSPKAVELLVGTGAVGASSSEDLISRLSLPRVVWLMVPADAVDSAIAELAPLLASGDTIVDGGNSYYLDDIRRAKELAPQGIRTVDVGTSGGIWGLERGYCQMIGGDEEAIKRLEPLFASLAPPAVSAPPTPGREPGTSTAEHGYLRCGRNGAGHFVKMIHNGIEYGLMAAYAEGFNILRNANIGRNCEPASAETAPLRDGEHYQYDFDIGDIAELWRRGSVVTSWLLDLTAAALVEDANLSRFMGSVSDSGEGRWTAKAAIDEGVPTPVLTAALQQRFSSRGQSDYANRLLSAMRAAFGGHVEKR